MTCITSPAIHAAALLAWIDDNAPPEISVHLAQCDDCRARAAQLSRWQNELATQLYRTDCPAGFELGEYHLGLLDAQRLLVVQAHLAHCLHCAREVQTLQAYLKTLAPALKPAAQPTYQPSVTVWIAKLVDALAELGSGDEPAPTFANLRGEGAEQLIYAVDDFQITIEVQTDTAQPDRRVMLGLVLGLEPGQTLVAHLWQANRQLTTTSVDELGNFVFAGLDSGQYELIFGSGELEIHLQALQV